MQAMHASYYKYYAMPAAATREGEKICPSHPREISISLLIARRRILLPKGRLGGLNGKEGAINVLIPCLLFLRCYFIISSFLIAHAPLALSSRPLRPLSPSPREPHQRTVVVSSARAPPP